MSVLSVDGRRSFQVDFGSSLNKAVLKLYLSLDEESIGSPVCLNFTVDFSSPTVRLQATVANTTDDMDDMATRDVSDSHQIVTSSGPRSITVLGGWQHVILTAQKVKVTRTAHRIVMRDIRFNAGLCSYQSSGK